MVLIESIASAELKPTNCDIHVEGGVIRAVAPQKYRRCLTLADDGSSGDEEQGCSFVEEFLCNSVHRRRLSSVAASMDDTDRWEGVKDMVVALDSAIIIDNETDLFKGKRILELGFVTGLPSALAFKHGAEFAHMHAWDAGNLETYLNPTLRRNNISPSRCKFSVGEYDDCKTSLKLQPVSYQVILAPELIAVQQDEFEHLHAILDQALAEDGIMFITARPYYEHASASLPAFMEFLKTKGRFDAFARWTAPPRASDNRPRKMLQITRCIR